MTRVTGASGRLLRRASRAVNAPPAQRTDRTVRMPWPQLAAVQQVRAAAGLGPAAGIGVRLDPRLDATNGPDVCVRGVERFAGPANLWATSYYGEPALTGIGTLAWRAAARVSWRWDFLPEGPRTDAEQAAFWAGGYAATRASQMSAVASASRYLGLDCRVVGDGLVVVAAATGGPLADLVRPGDVLVAADDVDLVSPTQAPQLLRNASTVTVRPVGRPAFVVALPAGAARLGLRLAAHRPRLVGGLDADVGLSPECSGPSAGLMLALGLVDVVTPGQLTGGAHVAGTGTLDAAGAVGPVSGVLWKAATAAAAGVSMFLCPPGTGDEARAGTKRGGPASTASLAVVEVSHLREAVDVLVDSGGDRPVLPS